MLPRVKGQQDKRIDSQTVILNHYKFLNKQSWMNQINDMVFIKKSPENA
jgi:hypothetical protein